MDKNRQKMRDEHRLAHLDGDDPSRSARYRARVVLDGAKRVLASIPSYAQLDAAHEARKAALTLAQRLDASAARALDDQRAREAAKVPAARPDARAQMRAYNQRLANAPVGFADDTGLAEYLQGQKAGRSFAPPSKAALSSAANVAAAAAMVEAKVSQLQEVLKAESAAIVQIERAQSELEEARAHLESVLAKQPATDVAKPDACADYLARIRDPYAAHRPAPKRN